ncbi:MAG: metallophosphoesterase [Chloroflexi bacterium]|nr:metallophosphoesterase [Chloroflexota bacterium]
MRCAIISDIHGNFDALERVIVDAMSFGSLDAIWCLGDIVGYGPNPNECVREIRDCELGGIPVHAVAGNHDRAATGKLSIAEFNPDAATAARWTINAITAETRAYLDGLPERLDGATIPTLGDFTLVHGTPHDPIWDYMDSHAVAFASLAEIDTPHCLVGHTHRAEYYSLHDPGHSGPLQPSDHRHEYDHGHEPASLLITLAAFTHGISIAVDPGVRLVANPGSVGQPRDGLSTASYLLLETTDGGQNSLRSRRVQYNIDDVQRKMREAGLPPRLIARLRHGR